MAYACLINSSWTNISWIHTWISALGLSHLHGSSGLLLREWYSSFWHIHRRRSLLPPKCLFFSPIIFKGDFVLKNTLQVWAKRLACGCNALIKLNGRVCLAVPPVKQSEVKAPFTRMFWLGPPVSLSCGPDRNFDSSLWSSRWKWTCVRLHPPTSNPPKTDGWEYVRHSLGGSDGSRVLTDRWSVYIQRPRGKSGLCPSCMSRPDTDLSSACSAEINRSIPRWASSLSKRTFPVWKGPCN